MISMSAKKGLGAAPPYMPECRSVFAPTRFDFRVNQPAQPDAQRRKIGRKQFRIADQREIGFQLAFLLADIFGDGLAADFFFAFDNELHIERQACRRGLASRLRRL